LNSKEQAIESILKLAVQGRLRYLVESRCSFERFDYGVLVEQATKDVGELFKQAELIGDNIE